MADNDVTIVVSSRDRSDPDKVRRRWRSTQREMERDSSDSGERSGKGWVRGFAESLGGGEGGSRIAGRFVSLFKATALTAAGAFAGQFVAAAVAGLASGATKIAHGLGSLSALLPAIALTGVAAFGALKLAVSGVGDALSAAVSGDAEEFHEAVKGLSPAARGFALEVRHLKGDLDGLKDSVQEGFFSEFAGQASKLGKTWLPILRRELTGVSGLFGSAVDRMAGWARQPAVVDSLSTALRNSRRTLGNLLDGASNLPAAFLPLVEVGSTFLPRLTSGFEGATQRLVLFMQHAADTGQLADFIQDGIDKLRDLWETAKQVGRIGGNIVDVFREIGSAGGGAFSALGISTGGLLDRFEALTEKAKVFFASSSGGEQMTQLFEVLHTLGSATAGVLVRLGQVVVSAFAPILPQLADFAEAVANLQHALVDALQPALEGLAGVLGAVLPPLTGMLNAIADNSVAAGALAGVIIGLVATWKLFSAATAIAKSNLTGMKLATGGVVTAVAGLAMGLIALDQANHAKETQDMVEAFIAADGAVTAQTRSIMFMNQALGGTDEFMRGLIEQSPRMAQSTIDNAEAFGLTTEQAEKYQEQLDVATAAQDNLTDAITRQRDAMREMTDPLFARLSAEQRLAEAQARLAELQASGTATAEELAAAHQDVGEAAYGLQGATFDLQAAMEAGDTSFKKVLKSLQAQRDSGAITEETYKSLAFQAAVQFGSAGESIERVPRSHTTKLEVKDRVTAVANKVAAKLQWLDRQSATVSIGASLNFSGLFGGLFGGNASGGISGAASGGIRNRRTWVGEHGAELVDLAPGSRVHSNPDSMRMAGQGGGGSPVLVFGGNPSDSLGRAIFDWLRDNIRDGHGGDVQRALGWS